MSTTIAEASKFDSWFQGAFDMPGPVTVEELDPSVLVDVELFNDYWSVGEPVESSTTQKPFTPVPTQQIELPDSELRSVTPGVFDLSLLPASFGDAQFNFEQATASQFNTSPSFGDTFCSANNGDKNHLQTHGTSENVTTSSPIPQFSLSDFQTPHTSDSQCTPFGDAVFDMEAFLSSFASATNPAATLSLSEESVVNNAWSQFITPQSFPPPEAPSTMPNVDPSLLMASLSPSDIIAQSYEVSRLNAEKNEKLEKLRAHQEAVRRLEAELA
jgi:hypothetical protein